MKLKLNRNNDTDNEEEEVNLPGYETVQIDNANLDNAHDFLDKYIPKSSEGNIDEPNGKEYPSDIGYVGSEDIDLPESVEVAAHKYNIEPDISKDQLIDFNPNRAFFGRHVVNSNTKRVDNFRQLLTIDVCFDYDLIPTRRQRATQLRQRTTAEYQMCRSNPEIGGFDRKLQRAVIKREDVDVRQTITDGTKKKKKRGMFGIGKG